MSESRHEFFCKRLKELGVSEASSDYDGMIGKSVEALSSVFASQGHSGASASMTIELFCGLLCEYDADMVQIMENAKGVPCQ